MASPQADLSTSQDQPVPEEDPQQDITVIDIKPTQGECRICLEVDAIENLVQPCQCKGSTAFAHLEPCLKHWVGERGSLKCEICGQQYKEPLMAVLKPEAEATLRRIEEARRQRQAQRQQIQQQQEQEDEEEYDDRKKAVCRGLCVVLAFGVLVCLLLVLGMEASESVWAAVALRIIAFTLPLFLVFKATMACFEMRRYHQELREEEQRNGAV